MCQLVLNWKSATFLQNGQSKSLFTSIKYFEVGRQIGPLYKRNIVLKVMRERPLYTLFPKNSMRVSTHFRNDVAKCTINAGSYHVLLQLWFISESLFQSHHRVIKQVCKKENCSLAHHKTLDWTRYVCTWCCFPHLAFHPFFSGNLRPFRHFPGKVIFFHKIIVDDIAPARTKFPNQLLINDASLKKSRVTCCCLLL